VRIAVGLVAAHRQEGAGEAQLPGDHINLAH
jgi:hypothetical protein